MAWYEDLAPGRSWASLWSDYILCGNCRGIRRFEESCPACGDPQARGALTKRRLDDGTEIAISETFMGAEGRAEDYLYLEMLQREWERPAPEFERFKGLPAHERPSARAALALPGAISRRGWSGYLSGECSTSPSQCARTYSTAIRRSAFDFIDSTNSCSASAILMICVT